jgi:hypothetical protein
MREADPVLEPGDVLELVNTEYLSRYVDAKHPGGILGAGFRQIKARTGFGAGRGSAIRVGDQKGTPQLKAFLDDFIKTHGVGTSFGNTVMRRYLKEGRVREGTLRK